ncbi:DUF2871 domain-containing protein [Microbacterium sp. CH12i]|uniref:DUF2871 domain-containing protein n=1 Tax=Microbacterium sp. CH12i TaxID=1479651 RepID=UPI0009DCFEAE|nr:DUF2871 domain-containing protein [Microbacterium sp. CH12i]
MTVETLPAQRSAQLLLLRAVAVYTVVGLAVGLFYREFTKANGYPEGLMGQLGLAHTHILTLGMIVLLIVLALEKVFVLSSSRLFRWFFWIYNAGVVLTGAMLIWHGMLQVQDLESSKMIAGIAGLGHMLVGAGFVLLLLSLRTAIRREPVRQEAARQDA